MTSREVLRERGWTDSRTRRRPRQRIDHDDRPNGGCALTITPSWLYACLECGEERRFASEDFVMYNRCGTCEALREFEPLGTLEYPDPEEVLE